jgi:N4-gp56 family major capsid protein
MPGNVNTTSFDQATNYLFVRNLLARSKPYLMHDKFGGSTSFAKRNGMSIKMRRHESWNVANVPILEGVTPAEEAPTKTDITATLRQYGNWVGLTDVAVNTSLEDVAAEQSDCAGENMGETMDIVFRDLLMGGTSVYYGNNVAGRVNVITHVEEADLQRIHRLLFANKAMYFATMTKGSTNVATSPIAPSFFALCHGNHLVDLEGLTGWKGVEKYSGQTQVYDSEFGSYGNFRFVGSQNAKVYPDAGGAAGLLISTTGVAADIYPILIFGKNAYDKVPLDTLNSRLIIKGFESGGTDDPLEQEMTVAWKAMTTLIITQDLNMYRYEVGCTA